MYNNIDEYRYSYHNISIIQCHNMETHLKKI